MCKGNRKFLSDSVRRFRTPVGFTFIEVILTISLFAVVMLVIVSGFYVGGRAWRIGISQSNKDYKIYFGLEKLSELIKEGIFFKKADDSYGEYLKFQGAPDRMFFAAIAQPREENKGAFDGISISKDGGNIVIQRTSFQDLMENKEGVKSTALTGIKNLSFKFGRINADTEGFEWIENWDDTADLNDGEGDIPVAFRISVEYEREGEVSLTVNKDVFLPQIQ